MKPIYWIIGGVAALLLIAKTATLSTLRFLAGSASFDFASPLQPLVNLQVRVQNPTNGTLTLQSLAGNFFLNGSNAGNVSMFSGPINIPPNSETAVNLQIRLSSPSLVGILANFVQNFSSDISLQVQGTANISNVPTPISLTYNPHL